jgi:formate dehydrogenase major subunit
MLKTKYAKETTIICPSCALGCGFIVHTSKKDNARVVNMEDYPDHEIKRGAPCSKDDSLTGLVEVAKLPELFRFRSMIRGVR